jgi:hypothetical protein
VFPARYELNSYIVFRKRLVSRRLTSYPMATANTFPGGKVEGSMKLTNHLHLIPVTRKMELFLTPLYHVNHPGVVFNKLSSEINLPILFLLYITEYIYRLGRSRNLFSQLEARFVRLVPSRD